MIAGQYFLSPSLPALGRGTTFLTARWNGSCPPAPVTYTKCQRSRPIRPTARAPAAVLIKLQNAHPPALTLKQSWQSIFTEKDRGNTKNPPPPPPPHKTINSVSKLELKSNVTLNLDVRSSGLSAKAQARPMAKSRKTAIII